MAPHDSSRGAGGAAPGRALSELTPIGRGSRTLSVTPVGNPGAVELEAGHRLVREFEINSVRDLDDWFMLEPENADRYIDLELTYLPTSIAFAMRDATLAAS